MTRHDQGHSLPPDGDLSEQIGRERQQLEFARLRVEKQLFEAQATQAAHRSHNMLETLGLVLFGAGLAAVTLLFAQMLI